jgi:SOS-response transcriptional repressor LexA
MVNEEATFMLKASNAAMAGAGIIAGDCVLLDRSRNPKDGDIVLAEADERTALRYFRNRGSRGYLEAANPDYRSIVPREKLTVTAVVIAVIRKYY